MCFYISPADPHPYNAEFDIPVWKVIVSVGDGNYVGPFNSNFIYRVGVRTPVVELIPERCGEIHYGYHSFSRASAAENLKRCCLNVLIGRFVIPAGSWFYFNQGFEECVSNQIIMESDDYTKL